MKRKSYSYQRSIAFEFFTYREHDTSRLTSKRPLIDFLCRIGLGASVAAPLMLRTLRGSVNFNVSTDAKQSSQGSSGAHQSDDVHDIHQMGGTALLSPDGHLLWMHVTQESTDRPTADNVIVEIANADSGPSS